MVPQQTLAAVLRAPRGVITVDPVEVREPGTGEVLVRMEACGLCHSDLFISGLESLPLLPLILGHEGIGRVAQVGADVEGLAPGDRVGITFLAASCGMCFLCLTGRERFCVKQRNFGFTVPGALAAYATLPVPHLARIPEELPAEQAAPLCCAGWTAYGALREAALHAGQTVALFGLGGLGHLAVQYARHLGLSVAAVDVSEEKLEMARALGAELTMISDGAGRKLHKQYGGLDAAIVFTASTAAIQQAFQSLKRTGTLILVGLTNNQAELPVLDTILKGICVRGSYLGSKEDLNEVLRLAMSGVARPQVETHGLQETPELFVKMGRGKVIGRAVVSF